MPHRSRLVALPLEDAGQVVVGVGVFRIELDGAPVRVGRLGQPAEIVERDAEVEGWRRDGLGSTALSAAR